MTLDPFLIVLHSYGDGSTDLLAVTDISHPRQKKYDASFVYSLGVRNDNSGKGRLSLYLGVRFVEDHFGFPVFCYPLGRQEEGFDWKKAVKDHAKVIAGNLCYLIDRRITGIRRTKISERKMRDLLWVGGRRKWVVWKNLGKIDRRMRGYPEHHWNLFFLLKEVAREGAKGPVMQQLPRSYAFLSWATGEGLKTSVGGGNDPLHHGRKQ